MPRSFRPSGVQRARRFVQGTEPRVLFDLTVGRQYRVLVVTGWAELLKRLRRLAAEGRQDPDAAWTKFEELALSSERANILKAVVRLGRLLPELERYRLAVAITRILAPVEWPPAWSAARPALVEALDALVEEADPDADDSFVATHDVDGNPDLRYVNHHVLYAARSLLRRPCRRDELRTVALLCNTGVALLLKEYRRATKDADTGTPSRAALDARRRLRRALAAYTEAASALNDAVGSVLFEGLHARLEGED